MTATSRPRVSTLLGALLLVTGCASTVAEPAQPPPAPLTALPALEDLPRGAAPEILWAQARTLHLPGRGTVELARRFLAIVPYDDGVLAVAPEGDGYRGAVLDADGRRLDVFPSALELAASYDGSTILYRRGDALLLRDNRTGASVPVRHAGPRGGEPVAAAVDGRRAWFSVRRPDGGLTGYSWISGKASPESRLVRDGNRDGARLRWWLRADHGSCSERLGPKGDALGQTCDWTLDAWSPDGEHVLAGPADRDGVGDRRLAILPNDHWEGRGRPVVDLRSTEPADPVFLDARWEDADSVLAIVARAVPGKPRWMVRLVRIDIGGSVEAVSDTLEVPEAENPFVLGAD